MYDPFHSNRTNLYYFIDLCMIYFIVIEQNHFLFYIILLNFVWSILFCYYKIHFVRIPLIQYKII